MRVHAPCNASGVFDVSRAHSCCCASAALTGRTCTILWSVLRASVSLPACLGDEPSTPLLLMHSCHFSELPRNPGQAVKLFFCSDSISRWRQTTYLVQNYCTLSSGDWNRSVSLVLWRLEGNLLPLAKIFSFLLYNDIVHQHLVNFIAVLQGFVSLQQKMLGRQRLCFQTRQLKLSAKPKARLSSKPKWIFSTMNMNLFRMFCCDLSWKKLYEYGWLKFDFLSISVTLYSMNIIWVYPV